MGLDLTECTARLAWASRHLENLREAIADYERSDPYTIRQEFDPRTYSSRIYITPSPVPMEISFRAGDVVHNLRSTLDHLAWQLAIALNSRAPVFPLVDDPDYQLWRYVFFPLHSKEDRKYPLPQFLESASDELKDFLKGIQPYAAADDPRDSTVWKLEELSNVDKLRVPLIAVPSLHQLESLTIDTPYSRVNTRILGHALVPHMLEGETLLVNIGYDTVPLAKPTVTLEHGVWVAFHDSLGIGPGMPVIETLDVIQAMVGYILTGVRVISERGNLKARTEGNERH